jgi:hypothetical protein
VKKWGLVKFLHWYRGKEKLHKLIFMKYDLFFFELFRRVFTFLSVNSFTVLNFKKRKITRKKEKRKKKKRKKKN